MAALTSSLAALEQSLRDRAAVDRVFLGRYQVLEVLGSGAMGTVFRGYDPRLERAVALKTLRLASRHPDGVDRATLRARLLREAVTVARFSHPNIVGIYDLEEQGDAAFLAMELVDGPSLERLIWQERRLSPARVAPLGAAVARALAAAHQHGIVHRDVKPANILLGRDGAIKVTDFGIAELLAAAVASGERIFGTPGYLAPEVLEGQGFTARADLFALGATLHASLLGTGPFQARNTREVVRRTLRGDVLSLGRRLEGLPAELDELILALLRRDPAERPASATVVAERLEALTVALGGHWEPPATVAADVNLALDPAEAGFGQPTTPPGAGAYWIPTSELRRATQASPAAGGPEKQT